MATAQKILFFDGVCNLCNQSVDFIIRHDKKHVIKFAPLQGKTAETLLAPNLRDSLKSMVLYDNGQIYLEADAAFRIGLELGPGFSLLGRLGSLVPVFLKSSVYNLVAKNRYRFFGKRDTCRVPTPEERGRFLD